VLLSTNAAVWLTIAAACVLDDRGGVERLERAWAALRMPKITIGYDRAVRTAALGVLVYVAAEVRAARIHTIAQTATIQTATDVWSQSAVRGLSAALFAAGGALVGCTALWFGLQ
jgi:hypothetical protein